jgi:CheY-like chemotaxis protein/transcriptional regulator with XRE-family HTH domain
MTLVTLLRSLAFFGLASKVTRRTSLGRGQDMTLECWEAELRQALSSLHDPEFVPSPRLRAVAGCEDSVGNGRFRHAIVEAMDSLKPDSDSPPATRARRIYDVLSLRYLQGLTQEATAERLGITARHLRREQREAVLVLAKRLLERHEQAFPRSRETAADVELPPVDLPAWRDQVRQELAALQRSAPDSVADVGEALHGAIALERSRLARLGVTVEVTETSERPIAAIHPSVLRQVLVNVIGQLGAHAAQGTLRVEIARSPDHAVVTLTARPVAPGVTVDVCLANEALSAQESALLVTADGDCLILRVTLPLADEITVLVVDDNYDLVHFYRRYAAGTRYRIVHVPNGRDALVAVDAYAPGIIVLDVMLPDVDGWELLGQLHGNPASRGIPIIVCSVIREAELALELGAMQYLPKPVRRSELLAALDRAAAVHPVLTPD